jgi:plastocyanin
MSGLRPVLGAAILALLAATAPASASAPPPARLQVVAKEFAFTLSRPKLRPGWAIVELANFGEDPHDLNLRRVGGTVTRRIGIVAAGEQGTLRARLLPGRYTLWCSIADHRSRGMQARLVVSAR